MLNDPHVLEASRVLAEKLAGEKSTVTDKLEKAFFSIVCRSPDSGELKILEEFYKEELQKFKSDPASSEVTLGVGEYPHAEKINKIEAAALMQTIHLIYNMEETITKT
jgi:hypothetical protein